MSDGPGPTSRPRLLSRTRHVVAAIDGGAAGDAVLDHAIDAARLLRARLTVVHVEGGIVSPLARPGADEPDAARVRAAAQARFDRHHAAVEGLDAHFVVVDGRVPDAVVQVVRDVGGDLLVVATEGRRGLAHEAQPSVTEILVRTCPCPVLSLHAAQTRAR